MINKYIKIIIPIVIITIILLPGCSSKSNKESKKPAQQSSQKPPEELKKMVSDIETMIADIAKLINMKSSTQQMKIADTSSNQSNTSEQGGNNKSRNSQNQSTQNKQQSGQQSGQQGGQTNSNSSMQQQKSWQTLETKSKDIHKNWNKIESEAIKAGLTVAERKNFKIAMENLTMEINKKNEMSSLKAAVELYGQYASLAKVFKSSIPADYYKTKYEIMAASIEAMEGEWDKAADRMTILKESWKSMKTQVKVKDEKLLNRSELSMDDFEAAVVGKNLDLVIIKAEIVLENLQQIEKALSKSNNAQSQ